MQNLYLATLLFFSVFSSALAAQSKPFNLGVIADCQYADQDNRGDKHYRSCPGKLTAAVKKFNQESLAGVLSLGDFIDRDEASFDTLLPITKPLQSPLYHVLGNHDFDVPDQVKTQVPNILSMPSRYYSFSVENWRFVVLDGNDISTFGWPKDSAKHKQNTALFATVYKGQETWNGAIGNEQLTWLKQELLNAVQNREKVVLLSHYPIYPEDPHNLWNAEQVLDLVSQHKVVKAWFNGHNHKGNYGQYKGIHFVTFHGMLNTAQNAFSTVRFAENKIEISGFGRQPSMTLTIQ